MRQEDVDNVMELADSVQKLRSRFLMLSATERRLRSELTDVQRDRFMAGEMLKAADQRLLKAKAALDG